MHAIFELYGWRAMDYQKVNHGLINSTFLIHTSEEKEFILQTINHEIFKAPDAIDHNIRLIGDYLKIHYPDYLFTHLVPNKDGNTLCLWEGKYYRAFNRIQGKSYDVISNPSQAKEAAKAFGTFTSKLGSFPINKLKITLPDFHNLSLRYQQFVSAIQNGNSERITSSSEAIQFLEDHHYLVQEFENFIADKNAVLRVTHHDTKISNVLFDQNEKVICVIDLDTVMPGYFLSDVGDMCRTYLPNVSEEEQNIDLINLDKGRWEAIKEGYMSAMGDVLTSFEIAHFEFAGSCMIYMQALRFLTDHLNNDVYYGAKYSGQNYVRATNQIALLKAYHQIIQ